MSSSASSELVFRAGRVSRVLEIRAHPAARGLRLSVDPLDGRVRLTIPRRHALAPAIGWAAGKRAWVEAQLARLPARRQLVAGGTLPVDGVERTIRVDADMARGVVLTPASIVVGGPADRLPSRLARWLLAQAHATLDGESRAAAQRAGVEVTTVRVGDPRSRWGSCTGGGAIRYSWRLVMAPPAVRELVVAHEVAHRLHMNHSPAFHAAVRALLGREPAAERAWLRTHGAALHAVELP